MRGQWRGAILITPLCESRCGFNGVSFTAGVNSAVLKTDTVLSLRTHTCTYTQSVSPPAGLRSMHPQSSVNLAHCIVPHGLLELQDFSGTSSHPETTLLPAAVQPVKPSRDESDLFLSWNQSRIHKRFWCSLDFMIKKLGLKVHAILVLISGMNETD